MMALLVAKAPLSLSRMLDRLFATIFKKAILNQPWQHWQIYVQLDLQA